MKERNRAPKVRRLPSFVMAALVVASVWAVRLAYHTHQLNPVGSQRPTHFDGCRLIDGFQPPSGEGG